MFLFPPRRGLSRTGGAEMFCEAENWAARGQRGSQYRDELEMIFRADCLQLNILEHITSSFLPLFRMEPTAQA